MNILVVDDHVILRKGLLEILRKEYKGCKCLEASNGIEAMSILKKENVDIVLSDIAMPALNGVDMLKQLKAFQIKTPVLILSMQPEDQYAVRVLKAGAYGFINKDCKPEILISAMNTVLSGKKYITSSISDLLADAIGNKQAKNQHDLLSDREMLVLHFIAKGKGLKDIADDLSLSEI